MHVTLSVQQLVCAVHQRLHYPCVPFISSCASQGWTALMRAASGGHLAVAQLLVSSGVDVNARDKGVRYATIWQLLVVVVSCCLMLQYLAAPWHFHTFVSLGLKNQNALLIACALPLFT